MRLALGAFIWGDHEPELLCIQSRDNRSGNGSICAEVDASHQHRLQKVDDAILWKRFNLKMDSARISVAIFLCRRCENMRCVR